MVAAHGEKQNDRDWNTQEVEQDRSHRSLPCNRTAKSQPGSRGFVSRQGAGALRSDED
jgi:hypothetical protein